MAASYVMVSEPVERTRLGGPVTEGSLLSSLLAEGGEVRLDRCLVGRCQAVRAEAGTFVGLGEHLERHCARRRSGGDAAGELAGGLAGGG
jgi:hypothetical protein